MLTPAEQEQLVAYYESDLMRQVETFTRWVKEELEGDSLCQEIRPLIVCRVKTPDSLRRKLQLDFGRGGKRDARVTPQNLNRYVQDLGGVRVIVHDRASIEPMIDVIERCYDQGIWEKTTGNTFFWDGDQPTARAGPGRRLKISPRGSYRGEHYIARREQHSQVRCEIQLRTVLEEAAFETRHRLIYRVDQDGGTPPQQVKDLLSTVTQMLALVDDLLTDCYRWSRE